MKRNIMVLFALIPFMVFSQQVKVPSYFTVDNNFSDSLHAIIKSAGLDSTFDVGEDGTEQVSFAVVDLNGKNCFTFNLLCEKEAKFRLAKSLYSR